MRGCAPQALSELKRLSNRTVSLAGRASQASLNRCQAVELLHIATGTTSMLAVASHDFLLHIIKPSRLVPGTWNLEALDFNRW